MRQRQRWLTVPLMFSALALFSISAWAERGGGGGGVGRPAQAGGSSHPAGFDKGEKKGWKGESHPPGWTKGKKKGWKKKETNHPPGWEKRD